MTEEGQVISCHTIQSWNEEVELGMENQKLCGPCQFISPILNDSARKMPIVKFLKVDVNELTSIAEDFGVEAMPTFVFIKKGKVIDKIVGAKKEELQLTIAKHATADASPSKAT